MPVRVVLDTTPQDNTAETFAQMLKYALKTAVPDESFTVVQSESEKRGELRHEFHVGGMRAVAESSVHDDRCLYVNPLEVADTNESSVMLLIVIAAERGKIFDLGLLTYCVGDIPEDLDRAFAIAVEHARATLVRHETSDQQDRMGKMLINGVNSGYILAAEMLAQQARPYLDG